MVLRWTVAAILEGIAKHWRIEADAEITLEANPTSVEAGRFRGYAQAGVNRVSIGVQALNDADLRALGRRHSVAEAVAALGTAKSIFPRLSFDLQCRSVAAIRNIAIFCARTSCTPAAIAPFPRPRPKRSTSRLIITSRVSLVPIWPTPTTIFFIVAAGATP